MHRRSISLAGIAAFVIASVAPSIAHAHAVVLSSRPEHGATVPPGELSIQLRFSSRIDAARSRLTLIAPTGVEAIIPFTDSGPGVVSARAQVDAPGLWTLRWQVLSIDGHVTRGDVPFAVARRSTGK